MSEDIPDTGGTPPPYQPDFDEIKRISKENKKEGRSGKSNLSDEVRRAIKDQVMEMLISGHNTTSINKAIRESFGVTYGTAKAYINKVMAEVGTIKAKYADDKDIQLWLALERYAQAYQIAFERRDTRNMIEANRRMVELQGLIQTQKAGITINNLNGGMGGLTHDMRNIPTTELANIVNVPYKRIESDQVVDAHIISAAEAERLLDE